MKYCLNCIDPDTRPNSRFNKNGICASYVDNLKNANTLKKHDLSWMNGLASKNKLFPYKYLSPRDFKKNKIKFSKFFKINSDLVYNKKLKYIIFGKGM